MAITIQEYCGGDGFAQTEKAEDYQMQIAEAKEKQSLTDTIAPDSVMVEIEAIHAFPYVTRNFTRYSAKCLKESIPSWTQPYRKPLIKHHDEEGGEPIGRVVSVEYVNRSKLSGTPALKFIVNVPDKQAKESIMNGLLSTVSIGSTVHRVTCSICGHEITSAEEGCPEGHVRGSMYQTENGCEPCCWDMQQIDGKELSYVVVPSDMYAKNISVYPALPAPSGGTQIQESLDPDIKQKGEDGMGKEKEQSETEELQKKIEALEKETAQLKESCKTAEEKLLSIEEQKTQLEGKIEALEKEKADLEEASGEAKKMQESMEKDLADAKAEMKESFVQTFLAMREALGRKVPDEKLIGERSIDSLKDSILDMKEALSASRVEITEKADAESASLPDAAGSVKSPALSSTNIDAEESEKKIKHVDLKAGLTNIFGSIMSARC